MTLTNHLIDTYEERGAPLTSLHPPQSVQHAAAAPPPISRNMQNQAGPSNYCGGGGGGGGGGSSGSAEGSWSNHGMPWWMAMPPHLMQPQHSFTPWSEDKVAQMQVRLARKLGPEYVTQRPGPGGGPKLSYIEAWKVINLANEVFGFNGWSSSIVSLVTDFIDVNEQGRCSISVSAQVRITLKDGAYHEDIGSGQAENVRGKASALDKAKKEAVTDAIKRALRNFGNVLGNCLYDKAFTANVAKMKVGPPKWVPEELERRPEFTEAGGVRPSAVGNMAAPPPLAHPAPIRQQQQLPPDPPRPGTPLRLINDISADQTMMTMDEHFDAEFLEGDDLFDVDVSRISDQASAQSRQTAHIASTSTRSGPSAPVAQAAQTGYQHRHRPDIPAEQSIGGTGTHIAGPIGIPVQRIRSETDRELAQDVGTAGPADAGPSRSSGSSGTAVEVNPNRPKGGAFIYPPNAATDRTAAKAGQSARAAAIRAASMVDVPQTAALPAPKTIGPVNDTTTHPTSGPGQRTPQVQPPIRAESPLIPNGGIDVVAARAAANYRTYAQRLELDSGIGADESPGMTVGGFTSARGMKRVISGDERNPSPRKQGNAPQQFQRSGPRRALGEIDVPDPDWEGSKRQRAM